MITVRAEQNLVTVYTYTSCHGLLTGDSSNSEVSLVSVGVGSGIGSWSSLLTFSLLSLASVWRLRTARSKHSYRYHRAAKVSESLGVRLINIHYLNYIHCEFTILMINHYNNLRIIEPIHATCSFLDMCLVVFPCSWFSCLEQFFSRLKTVSWLWIGELDGKNAWESLLWVQARMKSSFIFSYYWKKSFLFCIWVWYD